MLKIEEKQRSFSLSRSFDCVHDCTVRDCSASTGKFQIFLTLYGLKSTVDQVLFYPYIHMQENAKVLPELMVSSL